MVIEVCPRCNQTYARQPSNTDVIHICNSGDATLDNESVIEFSDWVDYTGSKDNAASITQTAGARVFQGDRAALEHSDNYTRDVRGKQTSVYRSRQRLTYIDKRDSDLNNAR